MPPAGPREERGSAPSARGPGRGLPGLLFVALLLVVYADPLFVRRSFGVRDLLGYNLPIEKAVHDAYARGHWPVWLAEVSGGRPLLANINAGALYPVRPLLSLIPFPLAMRIFPVLHWAVAGIGTILLLQAVGASRPAAWVGAVTYVFSGVSVSESVYTNHHPGVMLLPWIVWSVARASGAPSGRMVLTSLLLALDCLAGDVFTTGLALVAVLLWIVVERERSAWPGDVAVLAGSLALAALLALPQLVATVLWIPHTQRAVSGMSLSEALGRSVRPWRLLEFVVPYPFGPTWAAEPRLTWARPAFGGLSLGFFPTLYVGPFAACALGLTWRQKGRGFRFARVMAAVSLLVCTLPSLLPAAWLHGSAPLPLRHPEKMAVGVSLAAAVIAGLAIDAVRLDPRSRRWPVMIGGALAVASLASAGAPRAIGRMAAAAVRADPSVAASASAYLPRALAEGGLFWMASVLAIDCLQRPRRGSLAVAVVLVSLAPIAANRRIALSFPEAEIFAPPPFARVLDRRDPSHAYRVLGESFYASPSNVENERSFSDVASLDIPRRNWIFYTPVLWGRGTVFNDDFDVGDFSRVESLRTLSRAAPRFAHPGAFFGSVALRFGIRALDQPPVAGYRRFGGQGQQAWDENPDARPQVRLLERWREERNAVEAFRAIPDLAPGEIAIETGRTSRGEAPGGSVEIFEQSPEEMRLDTSAPAPTFLFVLRGFWEHRLVTVDGAAAPVFPAQLGFSALAVPAGRHRVDWKEEIPGGRASRWGPVAYAVIAAMLGLRARRSPAVR